MARLCQQLFTFTLMVKFSCSNYAIALHVYISPYRPTFRDTLYVDDTIEYLFCFNEAFL